MRMALVSWTFEIPHDIFDKTDFGNWSMESGFPTEAKAISFHPLNFHSIDSKSSAVFCYILIQRKYLIKTQWFHVENSFRTYV